MRINDRLRPLLPTAGAFRRGQHAGEMAFVQRPHIIIKNARLYKRDLEQDREELSDIGISGGIITAIEPDLPIADNSTMIDADGGALLPGLQDHHIHLISMAAALQSLHCGPPRIHSATELVTALRQHGPASPTSWLRGIGYHSSIAGDIDRHWLDQFIPDRPVRIQHRGGRLWVLNSCALNTLGEERLLTAPEGLEKCQPAGDLNQPAHLYTGRLYEGDQWLRRQLNTQIPSLQQASHLLASFGITGITDSSPNNGPREWNYFNRAQRQGEVLQSVRLMGTHQIASCPNGERLHPGEYKIHLLESQLPDFDELCNGIAVAHKAGQSVAIHCVSLAELVYSLSALETSGVRTGDRIEHASITPPTQLEQIKNLGLRVVTQPNFIAERGDQYRAEVEPDDQPWLYPVGRFLDAGIPLAGGSDAPFGNPDPWFAMRAAVHRKTVAGTVLGADEIISPEQALAMFLSAAETPGGPNRQIQTGRKADLCLLSEPWEKVRRNLDSTYCRLTIANGNIIFRHQEPGGHDRL